MIRVSIERDGQGRIRSYTVKGHAQYDVHGKDIVCAGVSTVAVGTVNSIEALLGVELSCTMKDGFLQASVPAAVDENKLEQVQLLLESMVVMLKAIEDTYGEFITIRQ